MDSDNEGSSEQEEAEQSDKDEKHTDEVQKD